MSTDASHDLARQAFFAGSWLLVACLAVQLFLVGLDVFEVPGGIGKVHRQFAYLYGWLVPVLVLLAAAARLPRWFRLTTVLLLVLYAVQTYLPSLQERLPLLAATHAVNALAVSSLAVAVAWRARELRQAH
jgi:hypothetical protein